MAEVPRDKLKLLHVAKMIAEETDADHGLTMPEMLQRLAEVGIQAERKGIYRDIDALVAMGMDIRKYQRSPVQYGLATRVFSDTELSLLVDAVQASRFLTSKKANALVEKIKTLASAGERTLLEKDMHVEGRIRTQQDSALRNVSVLQRAIAEKHKASFRYCEYDANCTLVARGTGEPYSVTPVRLVYSEGNYYLIAYSDKHESMRTYRVDRMQRVLVSHDPALRNELIATFDAEKFTNRAFSMFSGNSVTAQLRVEPSAINAVVDRFGADVPHAPAQDGSGAMVTSVRVMDSATFYGWLAQFGPAVKIESPKSLAEGFLAHIAGIAAAYE